MAGCGRCTPVSSESEIGCANGSVGAVERVRVDGNPDMNGMLWRTAGDSPEGVG